MYEGLVKAHSEYALATIASDIFEVWENMTGYTARLATLGPNFLSHSSYTFKLHLYSRYDKRVINVNGIKRLTYFAATMTQSYDLICTHASIWTSPSPNTNSLSESKRFSLLILRSLINRGNPACKIIVNDIFHHPLR